MADKKISQLASATLPLAGTELVPVVQSGATVKSPVSGVITASAGYTPAGTGAVARSVASKLQESVSVKDFGAVGDGVTDDLASISKALDYIKTTGGRIDFEGGKNYYVSGPIIIPYSTTQYRPITLNGNGSKLTGTLSTNIIETGLTTYSQGGTSNWNSTPEAYLHGNLKITGFVFETYNVAIRLYNAVFNSSIEGNYFAVGKTAIQAKRSFYLTIAQNTVRNGYIGKPDAEVAVSLEDFVNIIWFSDNHISGTTGSGNTGTNLSVSGGAYAMTLIGCGFEGAKVGVTISGENIPIDITGCYFEANAKSIVHTGGTYIGEITGCFFNDPITFESSSSPAVAFRNNSNFGSGTITAATSTARISIEELPIPISKTSVTSNLARPALQVISEMSKQSSTGGNRIIYDPAVGFAATAGVSTLTYDDQLMPFNYFGVPFRIDCPVPFCDTAWDGAGNLTITTRIKWTSNYNGGIEFDLTLFSFTGTEFISGRTKNDASIFRFDTPGKTVVASNASGYVKIVINGISTSSTPSVYGRVRVT